MVLWILSGTRLASTGSGAPMLGSASVNRLIDESTARTAVL